ncbi:hypothetical protein [Kitasatospora sp. NPDC057015]|uniref:hypothetical protein n=1 Tax=Kitasatospora sp. NPDC057015 TaxID=3346001 RepID=UPI00362C65E1
MAWGWGRTSWTTTTAPDTAVALTGPEGEYLLAVRTTADAPLLVGAARFDDIPPFAFGEVAPPAPVAVAAGAGPAAAAATIRDLAPRCRQAEWSTRSAAVTHAVECVRDLEAHGVAAPGRRGHGGGHRPEEARNRAAWRHVETLLAQAGQVTAGIRASTGIEDHLNPVIGPELRRLYAVDAARLQLQEIRTGWNEAMADITKAATAKGTDPLPVLRRAEHLRNHEAWPHVARLAAGPLPVLTAHVAPRIGTPTASRAARAQAARAGAVARPDRPPALPATPGPVQQPGPRRPAR